MLKPAPDLFFCIEMVLIQWEIVPFQWEDRAIFQWKIWVCVCLEMVIFQW